MKINTGKVISAQKVVIYGPEGIGKSTFAAQFPEPLFCDTEGSTKNLDVRRFDRPDSAQMIYECIDYVKAHPNVCRTFVLDTADWAERLLIRAVCARAKKSGIEDFGYGKGFTYLAEEFGKLLNQLEELVEHGINVVVTAHAALQKFEQPDESGAYDRWSLKLTKQCSPMLKEWADAVLFINYKTYVEKGEGNKYKASGGKRVMYTSHHACWDAKNRWGLPDECGFDYSVIAPYIVGGITGTPGKAPEPPARAPEPPKDPIAEIDSLVDTGADTAPAQPPSMTADGLRGVPKPLASLMAENGVTVEDIQLVVSQEGYYPRDTRIADYDPAFVEGCLVAAWPQVFSKIMSNKDLPFE